MDFLETIFLDNTVKSYLVVSGIILFVLLFKRILSHSLASLLFIIVRKNWKTVEKKEFINLFIKPLGWFLVVAISIFSIDKLAFPSQWNFTIYGHPSDEIFQRVGICLIIIYFINLVTSIINFIALILEQKSKFSKDKSHDQLIVFLRDFLKVIVTIAGILLVLRAGFHQNVGTLITGLSIVGAAMALAAKESLENLIASFIIFFDKPFFTGDTLKVNNVTGTVEHIGLRSTRIRTVDKTLVTVPNKQMVDSVVDNWSLRTQRRAEIKLEFVSSTTTKNIEHFIDSVKKVLEQHQNEIVKSSVFFSDFNKNGVTVTLEYFTLPFTMAEFNTLKQSVNISIKTIIEEQKLEMVSAGSDITIFNSDGNSSAPKSQSII